jgi:hypothetical protein
MNDKQLLDNLEARIRENPDIVPKVLKAVQEGMAGWEARVQARLNHHADLAITSALGLPARIKDWRTQNHGHRSMARLVAVGWGLVLRKASSALEIDLVDFVREADEWDPEAARTHYNTIGSRPVPGAPDA